MPLQDIKLMPGCEVFHGQSVMELQRGESVHKRIEIMQSMIQ